MNVTLLDRAVEAAVGLDLDSVPADVIAQAGHVIADTVGVSRGGGRSAVMTRLVDLETTEGLVLPMAAVGGAGWTSSVLAGGRVGRSAPERAAFLNATAGSFLELDEGMRPTGHPGMHVVPAALAVAESEHATGRDLLRAVLAGYEVTARLFCGFRLRYPMHPHGHFGAIGAAVAVALLRGCDAAGAARIAATTPTLSVWQACYDGATARNTWIGHAAEVGVRAASLLKAGFEGSPQALEVAFGSMVGELVDPEVIVAPLDYQKLGISRNYFKLHSACALTHAALDAVAQLDLGRPDDIVRVHVETVENNLKLDRQPQHNDLSIRFSLPYAVATAISLGRTDPEAFVFRPEIAELAHKVEVTMAPDLDAYWPDAAPARVSVETRHGSYSCTVENPRGHHSRPISADELRAKFDGLVGTEHAESWWSRLTDLGAVDDCATLLKADR